MGAQQSDNNKDDGANNSGDNFGGMNCCARPERSRANAPKTMLDGFLSPEARAGLGMSQESPKSPMGSSRQRRGSNFYTKDDLPTAGEGEQSPGSPTAKARKYSRAELDEMVEQGYGVDDEIQRARKAASNRRFHANEQLKNDPIFRQKLGLPERAEDKARRLGKMSPMSVKNDKPAPGSPLSKSRETSPTRR